MQLSSDQESKMAEAEYLLAGHDLTMTEVETDEARITNQIDGTEVYIQTYWPLNDRPCSIVVLGDPNDPQAQEILEIIRPITNNPRLALINVP